jgi:hypothetical protein
MHEARKKSAPAVQEKPVMTDKRPFEEMNTIAKQIKEQALGSHGWLLQAPKENHFIQLVPSWKVMPKKTSI